MSKQPKRSVDTDLHVFLRDRLPFTANFLYNLTHFPTQTGVTLAKENGEIKAALAIFLSCYNDHIWHDPIIWVTGELKDSISLISSEKSGKKIVISDNDICKELSSSDLNKACYQENLISAKSIPAHSSINEVTKLNEFNAVDSLEIAGISSEDENYGYYLEREKRFLKERDVFGIFKGEILVARGAIMSHNIQYSTIGAFIVNSEHRSMGFGTKIVTEVMKQALANSEQVCLFVNQSNQAALNLYRKLGFTFTQNAFFYDFNCGLHP